MRKAVLYRALDRRLRRLGLMARGGFRDAGATLVLAGNAGPGLWRRFERERWGGPDPLDDWTRRQCEPLARAFGAGVVFPFDGPPFAPFQTWALRAGGVFRSPLGPLIHPRFGLWHAWRAAFVFDGPIVLPRAAAQVSPCETCRTKPCLGACPVSAFADGGLDPGRCIGHLRSAKGGPCFEAGCLARAACPVGEQYRYLPDQAQFHLTAFTDLAG